MRLGLAAYGLLVAAVVGGCQPRPSQLSEQDAANVRAVFDSTVPRLRAGNYQAWAGEFSEDARFYAPNARPVIGRAAILAWGRALPPVEQFNIWDVQVAGAGNLAWSTSAYSIKLRDVPADTGKQLIVLRRTANGAWEVIAGGFSSNLPLAQPAPARRR